MVVLVELSVEKGYCYVKSSTPSCTSSLGAKSEDGMVEHTVKLREGSSKGQELIPGSVRRV